jgi:hypothetical protein
MTGSMSPRAKATLAAMRMAFRVANIARSLDIGHPLSFSDCVARVKCDLAHMRIAGLL